VSFLVGGSVFSAAKPFPYRPIKTRIIILFFVTFITFFVVSGDAAPGV
jgi:hypothetical protein